MVSIRISITLPQDVLEAVEEKRGQLPRSTFIRGLLLKSLGRLVSNNKDKGGKKKKHA